MSFCRCGYCLGHVTKFLVKSQAAESFTVILFAVFAGAPDKMTLIGEKIKNLNYSTSIIQLPPRTVKIQIME